MQYGEGQQRMRCPNINGVLQVLGNKWAHSGDNIQNGVKAMTYRTAHTSNDLWHCIKQNTTKCAKIRQSYIRNSRFMYLSNNTWYIRDSRFEISSWIKLKQSFEIFQIFGFWRDFWRTSTRLEYSRQKIRRTYGSMECSSVCLRIMKTLSTLPHFHMPVHSVDSAHLESMECSCPRRGRFFLEFSNLEFLTYHVSSYKYINF